MSMLSYNGYQKPKTNTRAASYARQQNPDNVRATAQAKLDEYKKAGILDSQGNPRQALQNQSAGKYLKNLRAAARTGKLPTTGGDLRSLINPSGKGGGSGYEVPSYTAGGSGSGSSSGGPGGPLSGVQSNVNSPLGS